MAWCQNFQLRTVKDGVQPALACEFHQPIKDKSAQAGPSKHLCIKRMFNIFPQFCLKTKSAHGPSYTDLALSKSNPLRMIQWHTTSCSNTITIYTQARLLHTNWCNWTSQIPQHTCDNWTLATEQNMLITKRINHLTAMIMLWTSLPFRTPTHFVS